MNLRWCRLGDALADGRGYFLPRGAFGHRPDLSSGPRYGGPTIPSGLKEQHLNPFTLDLEFNDLTHCALTWRISRLVDNTEGLPSGGSDRPAANTPLPRP